MVWNDQSTLWHSTLENTHLYANGTSKPVAQLRSIARCGRIFQQGTLAEPHAVGCCCHISACQRTKCLLLHEVCTTACKVHSPTCLSLDTLACISASAHPLQASTEGYLARSSLHQAMLAQLHLWSCSVTQGPVPRPA